MRSGKRIRGICHVLGVGDFLGKEQMGFYFQRKAAEVADGRKASVDGKLPSRPAQNADEGVGILPNPAIEFFVACTKCEQCAAVVYPEHGACKYRADAEKRGPKKTDVLGMIPVIAS